jgi:hypothetical protein
VVSVARALWRRFRPPPPGELVERHDSEDEWDEEHLDPEVLAAERRLRAVSSLSASALEWEIVLVEAHGLEVEVGCHVKPVMIAVHHALQELLPAMLRQAMPRVPRNNLAKRAAEASRNRGRKFMTAKQMMRPVSAG